MNIATVILVLVIMTDRTWQMNRWNLILLLVSIYLFVCCHWAVLFIPKKITKGNKVNGNKQYCPSSPAAPMVSITLARRVITAVQWLDSYLDVDWKVKMAVHWGVKSQESALISWWWQKTSAMGKVACKLFSLTDFCLRFHLSDRNITCLCKPYDCLFRY